MAAPVGAEYHWPCLARRGEGRVAVSPTPEELNIPKAKKINQIQSISLHTKKHIPTDTESQPTHSFVSEVSHRISPRRL